MKFSIEKCVMLTMKKWRKTNNARNISAKSRKNQNAWRKEKLQILENTGSRHHQTNGDERKNDKRVL